ncbi:hypothetical protein [Hydrogenobacter thermophilus]|uniref:hypothetical protein n=1 Tax=Hydrogenobacter thermophilus TaxID=940 RepID=UPI0030FCD32F
MRKLIDSELIRTLKEIIPADDFEVISCRKVKEQVYRIVAEDDEYVYKVELLINVREKEEDGMEYLTHKLLLFDYEEKASGKGMA